MLQRHSGPSLATASLAAAIMFAFGVSAQDMPSAPAPAQAEVVAPGPRAAQPTAETPVAVPAVPGVSSQESSTSQLAPSAEAPVPAPQMPAQAPGIAQEMPPVPEQEVQLPAEPEGLIESLLPEFVASQHSNLPHDLSPMGMFMAADWVVKSVMISLAFASLVTWTVWVAKTLQLTGAKARAAKGIRAILNARTLDGALEQLQKRGGTVATMVRVAHHEVRLSDAAIDHAGGDGVKERVGSALGRIEVQAGRNMSKGTGALATIGSTAPFVGLFGTVWGIMNSFIGISESQTTNLAVVAPGIAEALLATAIGLVAAIPAVIIYNVFARSVTAYRHSLADAAAGIERLVSRDLDFRGVPAEGRVAKIKLVTE